MWRHGSWSTMVQVMACCLTAPSHNLDHCWLENIGFRPRPNAQENHLTNLPKFAFQYHFVSNVWHLPGANELMKICVLYWKLGRVIEMEINISSKTIHDWFIKILRYHVLFTKLLFEFIYKMVLQIPCTTATIRDARPFNAVRMIMLTSFAQLTGHSIIKVYWLALASPILKSLEYYGHA